MDLEKQDHFLRFAENNPLMLCSEMPTEVLDETSYDDVEPSDFFKDFLRTGYTQWHLQKYGRTPRGREQITNAIIVLWVRARRLHVNQVLGRSDSDRDKLFFSDEGLYE
jgi:hypothetical protein